VTALPMRNLRDLSLFVVVRRSFVLTHRPSQHLLVVRVRRLSLVQMTLVHLGRNAGWTAMRSYFLCRFFRAFDRVPVANSLRVHFRFVGVSQSGGLIRKGIEVIRPGVMRFTVRGRLSVWSFDANTRRLRGFVFGKRVQHTLSGGARASPFFD